ncbi:MAG: LTA synthase family protein, partial [Oscillospiraceae bacterium]
SCVEYYKYLISGAHFLVSDLAMAKDIAELTRFTRIEWNPLLIISAFLIVAYVVCLWIIDAQFHSSIRLRGPLSVIVAAFTAVIITVPALFAPICTVFGIDNHYSYNSFSDDERFSHNNFITNFAVSINQQVASVIKKPRNYSETLVNSMLSEPSSTASRLTDSKKVKPNIVFIMSESFADFRKLIGINIPTDTYAVFDKLKEESFSGEAIVPTFGGNTVRTEFELMFGLPVKSLNNIVIPHQLLPAHVSFDTFAQMYKSQGYSTSYIHPFHSGFYGRKDVYSTYGFDRLLFLDGLTVPTTQWRTYVDDDSIYRQAEAVMAETNAPDYIYITSMQNHQPYASDDDTEINVYLKGLQKSAEELQCFLDRLKTFKEPTIVFFMGDHLPFFSPESNVYKEIGITAKNCEILYRQPYLIWNNEGFSEKGLPANTISAFYLPH